MIKVYNTRCNKSTNSFFRRPSSFIDTLSPLCSSLSSSSHLAYHFSSSFLNPSQSNSISYVQNFACLSNSQFPRRVKLAQTISRLQLSYSFAIFSRIYTSSYQFTKCVHQIPPCPSQRALRLAWLQVQLLRDFLNVRLLNFHI